MTECRWSGARWWKFDIHAHTPASKDYGKGKNQTSFQELSPKEWLLNYMQADIDCIAITDHNTGEWIDPIKKALDELESEKPEGFRPLHVFPGVEISVYGGVHLLAIFECDKTTSDIDSLLGAVGFPSTKKGSSDAVTTKTFTEVVEAIVSANGIAIPAHVDDCNGLFRLHGTTLQQVLECKDIFAMELRNPAYQKPQLYINGKTALDRNSWFGCSPSFRWHGTVISGQPLYLDQDGGAQHRGVAVGLIGRGTLRGALRPGY